MNRDKATEIASAFLCERHIVHCPPVRVRETAQGDVEVIFAVPEALREDVVVDPPEVGVWLTTIILADRRQLSWPVEGRRRGGPEAGLT